MHKCGYLDVVIRGAFIYPVSSTFTIFCPRDTWPRQLYKQMVTRTQQVEYLETQEVLEQKNMNKRERERELLFVLMVGSRVSVACRR